MPPTLFNVFSVKSLSRSIDAPKRVSWLSQLLGSTLPEMCIRDRRCIPERGTWHPPSGAG